MAEKRDHDKLPHALQPFSRALAVHDALPDRFRPSDKTPLQQCLAGSWPTLADLRALVEWGVASPPPQPNVEGIEEGIERAARYVEKQRDDYVQEFGMYDPSTGVTEFSTAGEEHLSTLEELIDGIRSLHETPTPPGNQIRTAECDGKDAVPVTGQLPVGTASTLPNVDGWTPPQDCDGKEQFAFEAWASGERYDMHEHPLHYLFMDKKTNAARQGWKAALRYVREQHALATTEGADNA